MTSEAKQKQRAMIVDHLLTKGSITSIDAINEFGCTRLAAQIWYLRHKRHFNINSEWEEGVNRFGQPCRYVRYILCEDGEGDGERAC